MGKRLENGISGGKLTEISQELVDNTTTVMKNLARLFNCPESCDVIIKVGSQRWVILESCDVIANVKTSNFGVKRRRLRFEFASQFAKSFHCIL